MIQLAFQLGNQEGRIPVKENDRSHVLIESKNALLDTQRGSFLLFSYRNEGQR